MNLRTLPEESNIPTLEDCYQFFAESIFENVPEAWTEAWIDAEVEDDWGHYKGYYKDSSQEEKRYVPKHKKDDMGILDVFLHMRSLMKHPDQEPWNRIRFWMTAEGDFKIDVKYPSETSTSSE